jgi:hypothetical protein
LDSELEDSITVFKETGPESGKCAKLVRARIQRRVLFELFDYLSKYKIINLISVLLLQNSQYDQKENFLTGPQKRENARKL